MKSIYRKLDATTRNQRKLDATTRHQTVTRARELGLLEPDGSRLALSVGSRGGPSRGRTAWSGRRWRSTSTAARQP